MRASRAAPEARLLRGKSALARAPTSIETTGGRTRTPEAMNEDACGTVEPVAIHLTRSRAKQVSSILR